MEKTYKRVPFDIETAKKITNGEVKGKILKKELKPDMFPVRFICFNSKVKGYPYIVLEYNPFCNNESVAYYENEDVCKRELIIELPEEAPKQNFETVAEANAYHDGYENGYNAGKSEAPKHEFKPFDRVFVRDSDEEEWTAAIFSHMTDLAQPYACVGNLYVYQCIPYEGNEHLVGTTDNPE